MQAPSSSPESSRASLGSGEGEPVPAPWLCLRHPSPAASLMALGGDSALFLLLFRRNLALPRRDLAPFAARQVTRLAVFLFQCFPSQATLPQGTISHLLLSGEWC